MSVSHPCLHNRYGKQLQAIKKQLNSPNKSQILQSDRHPFLHNRYGKHFKAVRQQSNSVKDYMAVAQLACCQNSSQAVVQQVICHEQQQ